MFSHFNYNGINFDDPLHCDCASNGHETEAEEAERIVAADFGASKEEETAHLTSTHTVSTVI